MPERINKLNVPLVALLAWAALGADSLSSSSYGPGRAFLALQGHWELALFVALASVLTIFIISACYSRIIELFPSGGGGYLAASRLISPTAGMISGSALIIDYILTITISIAAGTDALFSFLPPAWLSYRLYFALFALAGMALMNLRGVKWSVLVLIPFAAFLLTHVFVIVYAIASHGGNLSGLMTAAGARAHDARAMTGTFGMLFLVLKAYSMGAGTYTGIEAVSTGLPTLREPKVQTGKKTMRYMAFSLSFMVIGLMAAYLLFGVGRVPGRTLNAALYESVTRNWGAGGYILFIVTLLSEAALLLVAAQVGFLNGPRALANMALDRWLPTRFAALSDRLVRQRGILVMGVSAFLIMLLTRGSVAFLVVIYAVSVFITFSLSQLGMARHWWLARKQERRWGKRLLISVLGLFLSVLILGFLIVLKFTEGGWAAIVIIGIPVCLALLIKRHYSNTSTLLSRLDSLVEAAGYSLREAPMKLKQPGQAGQATPFDPNARTAILLVSGYNGLGLHTLFNIIRQFGGVFKNFVFIEVGVIDAGTFRGAEDLEMLKKKVGEDLGKYLKLTEAHGFHAEGFSSFGADIVEEISGICPRILEKYSQTTFFGGQLVFPNPNIFTAMLHNYTIFAVQRYFYNQGIPIMLMPVRV